MHEEVDGAGFVNDAGLGPDHCAVCVVFVFEFDLVGGVGGEEGGVPCYCFCENGGGLVGARF